MVEIAGLLGILTIGDTLARACELPLAELPEPHSPWLAWYRAVSQLKIALRSFLSLDAGWPDLVTAMLCEVDGALGRRPAGAGRAAAC